MNKIYLQGSDMFTYYSEVSGRYGLSRDARSVGDGLATGAIYLTRQEAIERGLVRIQRSLVRAMDRAVRAEEWGE